MFRKHCRWTASGWLCRGKKLFQEYLLRSFQLVCFKFEGIPYKVTIEDVKLFPQVTVDKKLCAMENVQESEVEKVFVTLYNNLSRNYSEILTTFIADRKLV